MLFRSTCSVEAAHIHPFSEAGGDDPRNGLALTPDMHWAMDKHLIAPGEDLKWHVSPVLDRKRLGTASCPYRRFRIAVANGVAAVPRCDCSCVMAVSSEHP